MNGTMTELEMLRLENEDFRKALREIFSLWPEPGRCAPINPEWVGERDGKTRAILLEAAINTARAALALDSLGIGEGG